MPIARQRVAKHIPAETNERNVGHLLLGKARNTQAIIG
jgi:hypothetical protein